MVKVEGFNVDELLALPSAELDAYALKGKPLVLRVGTADVLVELAVRGGALHVELAHIDGGGEGVLPTLWRVAGRLAEQRHLRSVEWRVLAASCARPNLKLRRVLERRGFALRDDAYVLSSPVSSSPRGR